MGKLVFLVMCTNELTDVFNFKDKKGKFEEKLGKDVRGLMGVEIYAMIYSGK